METGFNHFDKEGNAVMVDVSEKKTTSRVACAQGKIRVSKEILKAVREHSASKGDVLGVARIAGIMGAKRTPELIPLCHPLMMSHISVDFTIDEENCEIISCCTVGLEGKTGVEMEALCGVSASLLTIYDMCKAMDKHMVISDIHLVYKEGGKSGRFTFDKEDTEGKNESSGDYGK